ADVVVSRTEGAPAGEPRVLELGAAGFLFYGAGAGAYAGVSPFLAAEVADSILLRPSLLFGASSSPDVPASTMGGARFDVCARLGGLYASGTGVQLDACAGLEGGVAYVASGTGAGMPATGQTLPFFGVGPSVDLRGEVGSVAV